MNGSFKEKRGIERVPVNEEVVISHKNMFYAGTVLNLSGKGMFIGTMKFFPLNSRVAISFRKRNDSMNLFATIKRAAKINKFYDGFGVELSDPPQAYLELIDTFKKL
jgi:hypothetical protein